MKTGQAANSRCQESCLSRHFSLLAIHRAAGIGMFNLFTQQNLNERQRTFCVLIHHWKLLLDAGPGPVQRYVITNGQRGCYQRHDLRCLWKCPASTGWSWIIGDTCSSRISGWTSPELRLQSHGADQNSYSSSRTTLQPWCTAIQVSTKNDKGNEGMIMW